MTEVKYIYKDIRFWILVFFIVRLYGITNPPLETAHAWRQTTVCMVARNFVEVDPNILYPRIDIAGEKSGITGMEFPVLNYLIYAPSKLFGYNHWYGRLINLAISSLGIFFFFKLVLRYFDKRTAFISAIILLSSIWFAYSRKIMPDTFASSLAIISIYFGSSFFENNYKIKDLLLYVSCGALAVLSKLPVVFLFSIFILFIFQKKHGVRPKVLFVIASTFLLAPMILWYQLWVPYLVEEYGFWHFFMGKSLSQGFSEVMLNLPTASKHFYSSAIKYIGFTFFLFGVYKMIKYQNKKLIYSLIILTTTYLIIVFKAGNTFVEHAYYIIPFAPIVALIAAYGIGSLKSNRIILTILILISLEGILNQHQDFKIKDTTIGILDLESDLDLVSEPNDLIVINSRSNPTPMYFAHRKGWLADNKEFENDNFVDSLHQYGCDYIIILKQSFGQDLILDQKLLLDNPDYRIYKILE